MIIAFYKGAVHCNSDEDTLHEGVWAQVKGWMLREDEANVRIFRNWEEHDAVVYPEDEDEGDPMGEMMGRNV